MTDLGECSVHLIPEDASLSPLLPPTEEVSTHRVVKSREAWQVCEAARLLGLRVVDFDPLSNGTIRTSHYQESYKYPIIMMMYFSKEIGQGMY